MKKTCFLFLLLFLVKGGFYSFAQSTEISPISPNAASFAKYGDVPVSLYTGIPKISVPLYSIKIKDFELPISLNYHAGGIKVENVAPWVGMGWTLNAGGVLNRKQNGIRDEEMIDRYSAFENDISFLSSTEIFDSIYSAWEKYSSVGIRTKDELTKMQLNNSIQNLRASGYDTESDYFYFNCGYESGKFILNPTNQVHSIPKNNYIIKNNYPSKSFYSYNKQFFSQWTITNDKGIEYIFGQSRIEPDSLEFEITHPYGMRDEPSINTWYINEIKLPTGEQIFFSYDYYNYDLEFVERPNIHKNVMERVRTSFAKVLRLKEIIFPQGKIVFVPGSNRKDLINDKVLDKIQIYRKTDSGYEEYKNIKLVTNNPVNGNYSVDDNNFRLALNSVEFTSPSNSKSEIYSFEYVEGPGLTNTFGLPARMSMSQDLWGYYNGANNTSLEPYWLQANEDNFVGRFLRPSGVESRAIDTERSRYGTLKKIIYPTGGYTEFEYENNVARIPINNASLGYLNIKQVLESILDGIQNYTAGISVLNTNGNDEGYSDAFVLNCSSELLLSDAVHFTSHIMSGENPCTCNYIQPPGASGKFWDTALSLTLEELDIIDGTFKTKISTVYFDRSYSLDCNSVYRLKVKWNDAFDCIGSYAYFNADWIGPALTSQSSQVNSTDEILVGGLRIKKITDFDPVTSKEIVRKYNYNFSVSEDGLVPVSSGKIGYLPIAIQRDPCFIHDFEKTQDEIEWCSNRTGFNSIFFGTFNNSPLYITGGENFGYKKVTVEYGENGSGGRTVSYFTSNDDYPDGNLEASHFWPYPKIQSLDWKRGLLLEELHYSATNQYGDPDKSITYEYNFYDETPDMVNQIPNIQNTPFPLTEENTNNSYEGNVNTIAFLTNGFMPLREIANMNNVWYFFYPHRIQSSPFYLMKKTTIDRINTETVTKMIDYEQNPISFLTSSAKITNSNGNLTENKYRYPSDIGTGVYSDMVSKNMHNYPVEQITKVDGKITKSSLTTYKEDDGNYVPDENYILQITSPLASIDEFTGTAKDSDYGNTPEIKFIDYNSSGRLTKALTRDGLYQYYIWGYNNQYPVAKIVSSDDGLNASTLQSNVDNIPFSNSDIASDVSSDIGNLETALSSVLSDSDCMVTYYTYKPLIGLTSQTDTNGKSTYYEYDIFGRLKTVRDNDGKILNHYNYHYAGQQSANN